MATLETQYKNFLLENPKSKLTFEEWKREVLEPMATNILEQVESLQELQKLTEKNLKD